MDIDDYGTIYVGCEGGFGYLEPNSLGKMQYVSISAKYDSTIIKTTPIIWRVRVVNNEVYFNALNVLYRYSPYKKEAKSDLEKIKSWYPKSNFYIGFSLYNKFYICEKSTGLLEMINDSLTLVKNGEFFIKKAIFSMEPASLENDNEILITTKKKLYKFNPSQNSNNASAITEFNTLFDSIFESSEIYCCVTLPQKKYAIGTISNGVVVIDSLGNIIDIISKQNGLNDNTIWALKYYDRNIWMVTNNGISRVEIISPFRMLNEYNLLDGAVTSINKFNNNIYITTNSLGAYFLNTEKSKNQIPTFEKLETISETWITYNFFDTKKNTNDLIRKFIKYFTGYFFPNK